jgi:hypothetical protein
MCIDKKLLIKEAKQLKKAQKDQEKINLQQQKEAENKQLALQKEYKKIAKEDLKIVSQVEKAVKKAKKLAELTTKSQRKAVILANKLENSSIIQIDGPKLTQVFTNMNIRNKHELMIIPIKKFRLSSKKLFLTYARCPLDTEMIFRQLKLKFLNNPIEKYLIVQERHQDVGISGVQEHIHVYLKFKKKCNIKDANLLDVLGNSGVSYHGKYEPCKNENNTIEYLAKDIKSDTDWRASEEITLQLGALGEVLNNSEVMIELARKGEIQQALKFLEKTDPKSFLRNHHSYKKSFESLFLDSLVEGQKFTLDDFQYEEEVYQVFKKAFKSGLCVVAHGVPGCGKSHFVRILLQEKFFISSPLIINNIDSLRDYDRCKNQAIIFDDCNLLDLERSQLISILSTELGGTIQCRYQNVKIGPNTMRIFVQNMPLTNVLAKMNLGEDLALTRRFVQIKLENLIYVKLKEIVLPDVICL